MKHPINTLKNSLPYFPAGFPDETIVSRVTRFHIQSGNLSSNVTFRQLFDQAPFSLTCLVQPHFDHLAALLPGLADENLQRIEQQSTLSPLVQRFYAGTNHMRTSRAQNKRWIVGDRGIIKLCPDCLQADEHEYAWAYLHRSHQIPGVTACWRHNKALLDRCPACRCPYSLPLELVETAWRGCSCGLSTDGLVSQFSIVATEREHQVALFAHEMLIAPPQILNQKQLAQLYRQQAIAKGLGWGKFRVNRQLLTKRITNFFGATLLSRIDHAFRQNKGAHWGKVFEEKSSTESPLYRHILVAYYLFRDYQKFERQVEELLKECKQADDVPSHLLVEVEPDEDAELLDQLIRTALHNNYNINQLWSSRPAGMRRLFQSSTEKFKKLEEKLRAPRQRKKATENVTRTRETEQEDQRWADAVERSAKQLYGSNDCPSRVTKNTIMQAAWVIMGKKKVLPAPAYPLTMKALAMNAESQWHFYARRITWVLHSLIDPDTPMYGIRQISRLEHHKCKALLLHLADCPRGIGASAKSVAQYLGQKNIGRDWVGPEPNKKFENPGRTYRFRTDRYGSRGELAIRPYASRGQ